MKFVETSTEKELTFYVAGMVPGFLVHAGVKTGRLPPWFDLLHLPSLVAGLALLLFFVYMKLQKRQVKPGAWLCGVACVGWWTGTWIASRFV